MIPAVNKLNLIIVFILMLIVSSCNKQSDTNEFINKFNLKKIEDIKLRNHFKNYYVLEKEKNWEEAYHYRRPEFQNTVKYDIYKKNMEKDSKGWELISLKIISYREKDNIVYIKIEFLEKAPKNYFSDIVKKRMKIKFVETSVWEKTNSKWYVKNACERSHLFMNSEIVVN